MIDPYIRRARIERVIDGDTVEAVIDVGFHLTARHRLRIIGIDTPELRSRSLLERTRGAHARDFANAWVRDHAEHHAESADGSATYPFVIATRKADSFGRYLADVFCWAGHSYARAALDAGHAEAYPR